MEPDWLTQQGVALQKKTTHGFHMCLRFDDYSEPESSDTPFCYFCLYCVHPAPSLKEDNVHKLLAMHEWLHQPSIGALICTVMQPH